MSYEALGDWMAVGEKDSSFHLFNERPIIRILFYADSPYMTLEVEKDDWGLFYLKNLVDSHNPAFAKFYVDYQNRIPDVSIPANVNRLDALLAKGDYDEVWLFGVYQVKMEGPQTRENGGPNNELDVNEVKALNDWMSRGGILITGDHSNPDPRKAKDDPTVKDPKTYLNLGRALGFQVPRAGKLRNWQGPPTEDKVDNYNTQVSLDGTAFESLRWQEDPTPQTIELVPDAAAGRPHPLFYARKGWVTVFPDHMHEGQITIPDPTTLDGKEWPANGALRPEAHVVAYGKDKRPDRLNRRYALVAVYNGDPVGVGRVVSDSTWHHYVNVNLRGFAKDTGEGSVIDLLGQYYGNLALWLAPLDKRQAMKRAMFWWLSNHPAIIEESGSDAGRLGQLAIHLLLRDATPCEIQELLSLVGLRSLSPQEDVRSLPAEGLNQRALQELALGSIIKEYQQAFSAIARADASDSRRSMSAEALIKEGIIKAHNIYLRDLERRIEVARNSVQTLEAENDSNNPEGGEENG
jgi:hypothetical protein